MDSVTQASLEAESRDKKKYYFTDTTQRQILVAIMRSRLKLVMKLEVVGLELSPVTER